MAEAETSGRVRDTTEDEFTDGYVAPDEQSREDSGETRRRFGRITATRVSKQQEPQASAEAGVTEQSTSTIGVEQPLPRTRRCSICGLTGHRASTCPNAGSADIATRARKAPTGQQTAVIAPMLVGTMNFCVATTFGPECGLTDLEGKMLVPSVQRMFERLPAEAATKAAIFIDPAVILTVMVMWSKRIITVQRAKTIKEFAVTPAEAARAAGYSGYEYNTNGTSPAQAAQTQAQATTVSEPPAPNGTGYGPPAHIRRGFDDTV